MEGDSSVAGSALAGSAHDLEEDSAVIVMLRAAARSFLRRYALTVARHVRYRSVRMVRSQSTAKRVSPNMEAMIVVVAISRHAHSRASSAAISRHVLQSAASLLRARRHQTRASMRLCAMWPH